MSIPWPKRKIEKNIKIHVTSTKKKERKKVDLKGTWLLYECCMTVVSLLLYCGTLRGVHLC